jgi:cytohesin
MLLGLFKKKKLREWIAAGDLKAVRKQLDPENINARDEEGMSPLYYAIKARNPELTALFLEWGAAVDGDWSSGVKHAFILAIESFNLEVIKAFLDKGFIPPDRVCCRASDMPLLQYVCLEKKCRHYGLIQLLMESGCNVNALNHRDESLLTLVFRDKLSDVRLVSLILTQGVNFDQPQDRRLQPFRTLIFNQAKSDKEKLVLLQKIAPYVTPSRQDLQEALQRAVACHSAALFLELLKMMTLGTCPDWDAFETLEYFLSPAYFQRADQQRLIQIAKKFDLCLPISPEILPPLSDSRSKALNARQIHDLAADLKADLQQKRQVIEAFVENGGDLNGGDADPLKTPRFALCRLVQHPFNQVQAHLDLLLEFGVDLQWAEESPLFYAARCRQSEAVGYLLDKGADPLHISSDGRCLLSELTYDIDHRALPSYLERFYAILQMLFERLDDEQLRLLLNREFNYHWLNEAKEQQQRANLLTMALQQQGELRLKLIALFLERWELFSTDRLFVGASGEEAYFSAQLLGTGDRALIRLFLSHPGSTNLTQGACFYNALKAGLDLDLMKMIVDRLDDVNRLESFQELEKIGGRRYRMSALQSLAYIKDKFFSYRAEYTALVEDLLAKGGDLNIRGEVIEKDSEPQATTFLLECFKVDNLELFKHGLKAGADPKLPLGEAQDELLHCLIRYQHNSPAASKFSEYFSLLQRQNPEVCWRLNGRNESPLLVAAACCLSDICSLLIREGADLELSGGKDNFTPLVAAVSSAISINTARRLETVRTLLDKGAAIDRSVGGGMTPLMFAARNGSLSLVKLLLARGADIHKTDDMGWNAVGHLICGDYDYEVQNQYRANEAVKAQILQLLIERGITIDGDPSLSYTPLIGAVVFCRSHLLKHLLKAGADVNRGDARGNRPLLYALKERMAHYVHELLSCQGIDLNVINADGESFWHSIAAEGPTRACTEVRERLIAARVPADCDYSGRHPLHLAVDNGHVELIESLLKYCNCSTVTDSLGHTPLHSLSGAKLGNAVRSQICSLLVAHGADLNARNANGDTPLRLAQNAGLDDLAEQLIRLGADSALGVRKIGFSM